LNPKYQLKLLKKPFYGAWDAFSRRRRIIKKYCALENEAKDLLKLAMTEYFSE